MAAEVPARAPAGTEIARWSAKVLLVTAVVVLIGGAIWYARSATVPVIVAALVSTVLLPLIDWATRRGVPRGVAIATGRGGHQRGRRRGHDVASGHQRMGPPA